jgi:hypothetical protein
LAAVLALGLGAREAGATTIDFEGLPSLTDVAAASLPGVGISTALVVSQGDANLLTGFDTSKWATSGVQGLLNTLAPSIELTFSAPILAFSVNVVGLPDVGGFQQVLLQAYRGADLVAISVTDPTVLGDSGFAESLLSVAGLNIDRILLSPVSSALQNGVPIFTLGTTTSFFADDVSFTAVPEPAALTLVLLGLGGLALRGRTKGDA